MHEALSNESGDRALAVAVEHGVDIYVRAAPLWRSMHAAAISDPEVDAYEVSLIRQRPKCVATGVRRPSESPRSVE
jgi:hypothetical protein